MPSCILKITLAIFFTLHDGQNRAGKCTLCCDCTKNMQTIFVMCFRLTRVHCELVQQASLVRQTNDNCHFYPAQFNCSHDITVSRYTYTYTPYMCRHICFVQDMILTPSIRDRKANETVKHHRYKTRIFVGFLTK